MGARMVLTQFNGEIVATMSVNLLVAEANQTAKLKDKGDHGDDLSPEQP